MPLATVASPDRCKLPRPFWRTLEQLGLRPSAVLQLARLPATLHLDETAVISTSQLFAIWNAIESLSGDPAFSIRMVQETSTATHKLAFVAASYAADYRDGLARIARFKRMCSPDRLRFEENHQTVSIASEWHPGTGAEPALSVDANFALMIELGRRGSGHNIAPVAVEYARPGPGSDAHRAFFNCPIRFGAARDRLVLRAADLDRPFIGYNPELLEMLTPPLVAALAELEAQASLGEQIKYVLKRSMASGRPDVASVARELGLSERTLQRRITEEGTSFRALLTASRQEFGKHLLSDTAIDVEEVAYLLGYEDPNSFYRAFRDWEDTTPNRWRKINMNTFPLRTHRTAVH